MGSIPRRKVTMALAALACCTLTLACSEGHIGGVDEEDGSLNAGLKCGHGPHKPCDGGTASTSSSSGSGGGPADAGAPTLTVQTQNASGGVTVAVYPTTSGALSEGALGAPFSRSYDLGERVWLSAPLRSGDNYFVGWDEDGASYDTASTTSAVIDASHTLTAVYESPSCSGVVVPPGTGSLASAMTGKPAGTTYCIQAGVHWFTEALYPQAGDVLIGEPGATLVGSQVVGAFSFDGAHWVATYLSKRGCLLTACAANTPACIYPEKAFIDDQDLWQVDSLSALGPGEFFIDYGSSDCTSSTPATMKIYLADNPTGHVVEVTNGTGGLIGYSCCGTNVTVKNLVFDKFGGGYIPGMSQNAIKGANWLIENNEFKRVSYVGVVIGGGIARNNFIHDNGKYGIVGDGVFEGNVVSHNNTDGFDTNNDAGASKFLHTNGLVLRGNVVSNNTGNGLWTDYDNVNVTMENNLIEENTNAGIFHEVSCKATIKNNVLRGNNSANAGGSLWYAGQIYTRSSKDVEIVGNRVLAAGTAVHGVSIRGDSGMNYSTAQCGATYSTNIQVHGNVVSLDSVDLHGVVGSGGEPMDSSSYSNIQFYGNTYRLQDLGAAVFSYKGALTKDGWQAAGQDTDGQFLPL